MVARQSTAATDESREAEPVRRWPLSRVVYPPSTPVPPHQQYVPKHRSVPTPAQPVALSGPRHVGDRRRPARKALRTTVTLGGLAAAATGVAVATGVVQSPSSAVNLADSLSPASATTGTAPQSSVQDRTAVVSRSAARTS